uniref:Putative secreted protein n=1 Tax=Ixodes ricinus TaxID=34613 RepID=A0A6B0TST4_IXORI
MQYYVFEILCTSTMLLGTSLGSGYSGNKCSHEILVHDILTRSGKNCKTFGGAPLCLKLAAGGKSGNILLYTL